MRFRQFRTDHRPTVATDAERRVGLVAERPGACALAPTVGGTQNTTTSRLGYVVMYYDTERPFNCPHIMCNFLSALSSPPSTLDCKPRRR